MAQNLFNKITTQQRQIQLRQFEAVALPLMDKIYNTALRMTANELDAEDLVQNTFLKAWRYFDRFEAGTNFAGWIYRILTNNFITDYRKKQKQPVKLDFEIISATFANDTYRDTDSAPITDTDYQKLFDDDINAALQKLPEQYRQVVLLCDVNGLRYKETAEALNCPIGTVMSRLNRGRQILAKSLKKYAVGNGYVAASC